MLIAIATSVAALLPFISAQQPGGVTAPLSYLQSRRSTAIQGGEGGHSIFSCVFVVAPRYFLLDQTLSGMVAWLDLNAAQGTAPSLAWRGRSFPARAARSVVLTGTFLIEHLALYMRNSLMQTGTFLIEHLALYMRNSLMHILGLLPQHFSGELLALALGERCSLSSVSLLGMTQ